MHRNIVYVLLGMILVSEPVFALTSSCASSGISIVYVNGILTDEIDAGLDKDSLEANFAYFSNRTDTKFINGYNPSHGGGLGDVIQSAAQILNIPISNYDRDTILHQIHPEITTRKIILVGHSQGTFYTNKIYDYLINNGVSKEAIGVYNLATPANSVAGGGEYLTSQNDKVINAARVAASMLGAEQPLRANISIPLSPQEATDLLDGHSFSGVYLDGAPVQIVTSIDSALKNLSIGEIPSVLNNGCFTLPAKGVAYYAQGAAFAVADTIASSAVARAQLTASMAVTGIKNSYAFIESIGEKSNDAVSQVISSIVGAVSSFSVPTNGGAKLASVVDTLGGIFSVGPNQGLKLAATVDLNEKNIDPTITNQESGTIKADAVSGELISIQDFINDTQNEDVIIGQVKNTDLAAAVNGIEEKLVPVCKFITDKLPSHQKLIINEVAWMGGIGSANDEWIELRNISGGELNISGWQVLDKEEQIKITFGRNTKVGNGGYLLLERTDDDSVPETKADAIYAGALSNSDEGLRLYDNECNLSDEVLASTDWPAGDSGMRKTMERQNDLSWHAYSGSGITLGSMLIMGTPRSENSQVSVTSTGVSTVNTPAITAVSSPQASAEPLKILISEVQIAGGIGKSNNDFIEIYNPNSTRVNLNGYRLVKRTKTGTTDSSIKSWTSDAYIPAQGYYLWANSDYATISAAPDITTSANISNDNGVAIRYGSEDIGAVIDSVSWGSAVNSFIESQAFAENPIANQSISRRTEIDDNNNSADFMKSRLSPKNSNTSGGFVAPIDWSSQSAAPAEHILISEVYPDRTGANRDFIEIYNPNSAEDISGWSLQILSANATSTDKIAKKNFVSGNQIPESGFFLVGIDNYDGADMSWVSGSLNSTDGATIFLVRATTTIESFEDSRIVDRIAYGSGAGSIFPEASALPMPAAGKSLERKALQDGLCISAAGIGSSATANAGQASSLAPGRSGGQALRAEFLGNGCDTDNNSINFEERAVPNPQKLSSLIEPRLAPSAINNFTSSYSTSTLQVLLRWDESNDSAGATSSVSYVISYATSTSASLRDLIIVTATSTYNYKVDEVGINYRFSVVAKDKDGLMGEGAVIELDVPSIFKNAYFYPDPRNPGDNVIEIRHDSYPIINNPYESRENWQIVIPYKNQEAPAIPYFYSDLQYGTLPDGVSPKEYGEWGNAISSAWKLRFSNCAGGDTNGTAMILPDNNSQCHPFYGGVRNSSLNRSRLADSEDMNLIVSLSNNQPAPVDGDYVTFGLYVWDARYNGQRLWAVDRQKYNFQNSVPSHQSPELGGELTLNFNKSQSQLEIGWQKATDSDTPDNMLTYEISYDAGINWGSTDVYSKINRNVAPGHSFSILVRAKDGFGNSSNPPLSANWSYPETTFFVSQAEANSWSAGFGTKNPNCPGCFGFASLQSIQPQEDFTFNLITLKLKQETVSDFATLSLVVYPDLNGLPDFGALISEAQLTSMLKPDPDSEISFTFDNPVSFTAQIKYWLVLSVKEYGDSRGYFRNQWRNAVNIGSDLYAGGQAGTGNSGACDSYCAFTVPYPDANADWYMKIGMTQ